jgi:hypothetical protein
VPSPRDGSAPQLGSVREILDAQIRATLPPLLRAEVIRAAAENPRLSFLSRLAAQR